MVSPGKEGIRVLTTFHSSAAPPEGGLSACDKASRISECALLLRNLCIRLADDCRRVGAFVIHVDCACPCTSQSAFTPAWMQRIVHGKFRCAKRAAWLTISGWPRLAYAAGLLAVVAALGR